MHERQQRYDWRLERCFILSKGAHRAACDLWTHPLGWELRLEAPGELVRTQVCHTQDEICDTFEQWKSGMMEKGWK